MKSMLKIQGQDNPHSQELAADRALWRDHGDVLELGNPMMSQSAAITDYNTLVDIERPHVLRTPYGSSEYYSQVLLPPDLILQKAAELQCLAAARNVTAMLEPDDYLRMLLSYYDKGMATFGESWGYVDISSALIAAATLTKPRNYLEVGVRRGRSLACVASAVPDVAISAFDMWIANYGNNPNPGPEFVTSELTKFAFRGAIEFINGNSHETLPQYFGSNPGVEFDLMTIDGDHTYYGALADLRDALPHLAIGGVVIFDDVGHPRLPHLIEAWKTAMQEDRGIKFAVYDGLGYGVAVGVRHWEPGAPKLRRLSETMPKPAGVVR